MILLCTNDVEATETHLKAVGFSVNRDLSSPIRNVFFW